MKNKKVTLICLALVIILGFAVYGNSLGGQFIWDDDFLIKNNAYIKDWSHAADIFSKDIGAGAGKKYSAYRPVQILSYALDYSLWGLNAKGFRLTNLLLHILAALSVYWLIALLFKNRLLALFTSLLFIVHPVHTEAVSYISGRADLLAVLFICFSLIFYIKNLDAKSAGVNALMIVSYSLALLSRESSVVFVPLLLLYHYAFRKKIVADSFIPVASLTLFYFFVRLVFLKGILPELNTVTTTAFQRMPGFFVALVSYLRLLLLPFDLHMEYGNKIFSFADPKALLGLAIFVALSVYAFKKRKAGPVILFSTGWFFIALAPVANIFFPVNAYMAEHWLYLPSIGFFLLVSRLGQGLALPKVLGRWARPRLAQVVAVLLVASYACLTVKQNAYWNDPLTFFQRTVRYAPDSHRLHYDFGNFLEAQGRYDEAISHYKRSIELNPRNALVYNNLAITYFETGKTDEAIATFKKAIQADPSYKDAYYNLSLVVLKSSQGSQGRFNVILIVVDALRADRLGCYGYSRDTSPNIDKLAKEGALFSQAFSHGAGTRIAVASLLTSFYPSVHQVYTLESSLEDRFVTLAEVLQENGFVTVAFAPDNVPASYNFFQGFDSFYELPHSSDSAQKSTDKILAWLNQNRDSGKRFFIYAHYFGLHAPYIVPDPYERLFWQGPVDGKMRDFARRFARTKNYDPTRGGMIPEGAMAGYLESQYDAKVRYTDDSLAELFKGLKALGLWDNTLIILTSDHGEELMDHGNFFHEQSLYDELIRVPLIMRLPKAIAENKTMPQMARHIDVMPTVLEMLNIYPSSPMQGDSLLSLIRGKTVPEPDTFSEAHYSGEHLKAIRTDRWKLIETHDLGSRSYSYELYDLKSDPKEAGNLALRSLKALNLLQAQLKDYSVSCEKIRNSILGEGFEAKPVILDEETKEKLKSLGYVQ